MDNTLPGKHKEGWGFFNGRGGKKIAKARLAKLQANPPAPWNGPPWQNYIIRIGGHTQWLE